MKIKFAKSGKEEEIKSFVRDLSASGKDFAKLDANSIIIRVDSEKYREIKKAKALIFPVAGEKDYCMAIWKAGPDGDKAAGKQ